MDLVPQFVLYSVSEFCYILQPSNWKLVVNSVNVYKCQLMWLALVSLTMNTF